MIKESNTLKRFLESLYTFDNVYIWGPFVHYMINSENFPKYDAIYINTDNVFFIQRLEKNINWEMKNKKIYYNMINYTFVNKDLDLVLHITFVARPKEFIKISLLDIDRVYLYKGYLYNFTDEIAKAFETKVATHILYRKSKNTLKYFEKLKNNGWTIKTKL
jgi:hypothetical protein